MKKIILLILLITNCAIAFGQTVMADPTFNPGGTGPNNTVYACAVLPNGKILIGGFFTEYNGIPRNKLALLNADGTLDLSFDPGIGPSVAWYASTINAIAVDENGKIYIGGFFSHYDGTFSNLLARVNMDGTIDTSFNPNFYLSGATTYPKVRDIKIDSDGNVIVAGGFTCISDLDNSLHEFVCKFNQNGEIMNFPDFLGAQVIGFDSEGRVYVGRFDSDQSLIRVFPDGNIDTSFDSVIRGNLRSINEDQNGNLLLGGCLVAQDVNNASALVRLTPDSDIDSSFTSFTTPVNFPSLPIQPTISSVSTIADNKYLVAGNITAYAGQNVNHIFVLNEEGTVNNVYDFGTGFTGSVITLRFYNNNQILVSSTGTIYNGNNVGYFTRLSGVPLSNIVFEEKDEIIYVYNENGSKAIAAFDEIDEVNIYDFSGKHIDTYCAINSSSFKIPYGNNYQIICVVKLKDNSIHSVKIVN